MPIPSYWLSVRPGAQSKGGIMRRVLTFSRAAGAMLIFAALFVSKAAVADNCSTLMQQNYSYSLSNGDSGTISFVYNGYPLFHHNVEVASGGTTNWYDPDDTNAGAQPCTDGPPGSGSATFYLYPLTGTPCGDGSSQWDQWTITPSGPNSSTYSITTVNSGSGTATSGATGLAQCSSSSARGRPPAASPAQGPPH